MGPGRRSIASSCAKLEPMGLCPRPAADRRTLIRRVTFDLIGLPPTPEEVDAFLADDVARRLREGRRPAARLAPLRRAVGAALARRRPLRRGPGATRSQPRLYPDGYRYRDWVIRAFNDDMPYDRFVREQIAGDLLDEPGRARSGWPRLGFFALGPVYYGDAKQLDQYRRPDRHPDPRRPRADGRLRPLPRPQVRPDPDDRLLRARRRLRQHRVHARPPCAPKDQVEAYDERPGRPSGKKTQQINELPQGRGGTAEAEGAQEPGREEAPGRLAEEAGRAAGRAASGSRSRRRPSTP